MPDRAPRAGTAAPSKASTQERILEAAIALFAAHGFEGTSTAAIAARAGVSRSAVFWHFSDKENLFREAFRRITRPFVEAFRARVHQLPPRERLFELFDAYERIVEDNASTTHSIVRWLLESEKLRASLLDTLFELHGRFLGELRIAFADSVAADEAEALAGALLSLLDGNLLLMLLDPDPAQRERRRQNLRTLTRRLLDEGPAAPARRGS